MNKKLEFIIDTLQRRMDGIYESSSLSKSSDQSVEVKLRKKVAEKKCNNPFLVIKKSHSIPVMDYEVKRFLSKIPQDGLILDIGGGWGWHWRNLSEQRPDIGVVIVDFVHENFSHAKNILDTLIDTQIILVHADATNLPFSNANEAKVSFDAVWSVQTLQHIPKFEKAIYEAHRVLHNGGVLFNYSLHKTPLNKIIYKLLGKKMHETGFLNGQFFLERANNKQKRVISKIFNHNVKDRYTECLFHPDLGLELSGRFGDYLGRLDSGLSNYTFSKVIARQRSFEVKKRV